MCRTYYQDYYCHFPYVVQCNYTHIRTLSCVNSPSFCGLSQFIDLCILMGCDYCATIKGIGPKRAIDLIKQHGSIEEILENIDPNVSWCRYSTEVQVVKNERSGSDSFCVLLAFMQKHPAPEDWLYKEARGLFLKPEVVDCSTVDLKWNEPDEDALIQFMCDEKQFRWALIRLSSTQCCVLDLSSLFVC